MFVVQLFHVVIGEKMCKVELGFHNVFQLLA